MSEYHDKLYEIHGITKPIFFNSSVTKRRADFLAGRILAKYAFQLPQKKLFKLDYDENHCPLWPSGTVGSITHSYGSGAVVVSSHPEIKSVGIDLEKVMSTEVAKSISEQILSSIEIELLTGTTGISNLVLTLIFSAKESCYKAIYPFFRRVLGFHDLEVFKVDTVQNIILMRFAKSLSNNFAQDYELCIRYSYADSMVMTMVII